MSAIVSILLFQTSNESKLTLNVAAVDALNDNLGGLAINLASNTVGSSENLLDTTSEVLGERLVAHGAGNIDDLLERDGLAVLDVLLLLAVTGRLLEGLDDQGRGGRDDRDGGLTVLDGELDSHAQAFLLFQWVSFAKLPLIISFNVILTQSPVALAMSSPTFFGDRPRGPILGARAEEAPTSPPVARRWLFQSQHWNSDLPRWAVKRT